MDKDKVTAVYRVKSDESLIAAKLCFEKKLYRAACNRAWYSIMQIITAGAYQELEQTPVGDRFNYSHSSQTRVFGDLIEGAGRLDYAHLRIGIRQSLERRNIADYALENEKLSLPDARASIATAEEVRRVITMIAGPAWQ